MRQFVIVLYKIGTGESEINISADGRWAPMLISGGYALEELIFFN
jgi:hypothetical protein